MLLACMACLWPLCFKFSSGGWDFWAIPICIFTLTASFVDFNYRKIPNELVMLILIISCALSIYRTIAYNDFNYLFRAISGGIGAIAPLIAAVLLLEKGIGTGDIKLMFALGVYLGAPAAVHFFAVAFILAFAVAIVLLAMKKAGRRSKIVMGPFIACSFVISIYFDYFFESLNLYLRLR